ncbi:MULTISPECIES: MarR family winged helix-turn-helix transcriptional regulator [Kitasatospora]|uniref:Putative MarR family transcriptional regulator n=1 Tax=Kitasatospora setae (strain ATCC 33774 / DSM 43861 / JCM 3304 / KCC A-0304 / NBRC 14216 / KM-6054) TaxID=452652 RepID=E4N0U0_KITSK|nr:MULTISPECIES: MarR family winged helix-turn-helix transcriptional regulator [Kitasatospora]BAJ31774.1 putative MarR family transcriptional regulator [Kitasatospora setae KM-6054]
MSTDEPRWLDPEEEETWLAMVTLLTRFPGALDTQLQRDAGLSHFEYQVLSGLSMTPGRTLRMSVLAEFAACSLSRLSHTAKRLEAKGWLRRTPDPEDGRYTLAVLTEEGWEKVVATAPGHVAEVRRLLFDPLTKGQYGQLKSISHRINEAIGPLRGCPSHPAPPAPPSSP